MRTVGVRPCRSRPSLACVVLVLLSSGPETSKDRGLGAAEPDFVGQSLAPRDAWMARNLARPIRLTRQWREVADRYLGDYYPLTPYTLSERAWMAFEFNRPEAGDGMVLAYRRSLCDASEERFRLRGLESGATYEVVDLDRPDEATRFRGLDLMDCGLPVALSERSWAAILSYVREKI